MKVCSLSRIARKVNIVTSAALALLGEFSHSNNYTKRIYTVYFYAAGAQRQVISILSHLGIAESYSNLIDKSRPIKTTIPERGGSTGDLEHGINVSPNPTVSTAHVIPPTPVTTATTEGSHVNAVEDSSNAATSAADAPGPHTSGTTASAASDVPKSRKSYRKQPGTLRMLSMSMRRVARSVASTGLYAACYDNINMMLRVSEQILGRTDAQENGTCATIWPLWNAVLEDMQLSDFERSFDKAAPLSIDDILLNAEETKQLEQCLVHTILRIIVKHGGEKLKRFVKDLNNSEPQTDGKIGLHKTPLHPLPPMEIDEATIIGNSEVTEAIFAELRVIMSSRTFLNIVKIFAGDQLSIARLRALANIRAGQEGGFSSFGWGAWMPGLFHGKIADMHGMLVTHWGKPNAGISNPGCLAFHNTCLHRSPITLSSLPTFRTCRDLIFVSLYARVLHCLLLVSGKRTLDEYADSVDSWDAICAHAHEIFRRFATTNIATSLRSQRRNEGPNHGDMVFENAILFLRDALLSREFTDSIKSGDSGRVLLVLKVWALSYRGSGRTKYAHEMLHLIHNLTKVWPKPLCRIIMDNWLLNPTGKPNSWVEVDLMQEHMNYWVKTVYKAHGSSASWEWLEMIGPCVDVLRHLANKMKVILGSDQGISHAQANLVNDISLLISSLDQHDVYRLKKGRVLDEDDLPVKDVTSVGLENLMNDKSPLDEYNKAFTRLQARRRLVPVIGPPSSSHISADAQPDPEAYHEAAVTAFQTNTGPKTSPAELRAAETAVEHSDDDDDDEESESGELDSMEDQEPTLARVSAEDVDLDMDGDADAGEEQVDGADEEDDSEDEMGFVGLEDGDNDDNL